MKRWGGKGRPNKGVSRWLLQVKKESPDEPPLVVPKVIRQYTRRKKDPLVKSQHRLNASATHLDRNVAEIKVDNHNHFKIKEECIPDNEIVDVKINNHVNIEEDYISKLRVSNDNDTNSDQNYRHKRVDYQNHVHIKEEIATGANSSDSLDIEKEQKHRMDVSVKIEPLNDLNKADFDQIITPRCRTTVPTMEEDKHVRIQPKTDKIEAYDILNRINSIKEAEIEIKKEDKTLLIEKIDIKEEIESVNDIDCEFAVIMEDWSSVPCNIKKEAAYDIESRQNAKSNVLQLEEVGLKRLNQSPSQLEQMKLNKIINLPQSPTQGSGDIVKTCGKKQDVIALKKCYLLPVNVEPANAQQVVDPESLTGFKVVAKSQIFTCEMCGQHFLSKLGVRNHVRSAHSVATPCACHCGAQFPYHFMLLAHMRSHSGSLACDLCRKHFKSTQKYASHLNTHLRERLYPCPVCMQRFTLLTALGHHAGTHTTSDVFQCSSCDFSFRCVTDLKRHSEREHGERVEFPCYVCNRILSSNAEFIAHVKTHDNALHKCAFCSQRFTDFTKWEEHSNTHILTIGITAAAMRPFVCSVCRKRFEFRSVLKTHLRSHAGDRPYECKECSKKFKTRSAATEHEKGHSRPYQCPECPARFGKRDSVSRHVLLHSGERPHACPSCPRKFTQRSAMRQHVQRFHAPGLKRAPKKKGRKKIKSN